MGISNRASKLCVGLLALLALVYCKMSFAAAAPAPVQGPTASAQSLGAFFGTVQDSTGAVIPGAAITITNTTTNETFSAKTGADGTFHFANVPLGNYTLRAAAAGFRAFQTSVQIQPGEANSQAIKLEVGVSAQEVEVTSGEGGGGSAHQPHRHLLSPRS